MAHNAIYLKDHGGLLTVDRARTLLPVLVKNANRVPVELHSHFTTWLAPLVCMRRAKELVVWERPDVPLEQIRAKLGGPGVSDDEFLLRYIMKGEDEIRAMRATPPRQYHLGPAPLVTLLEELGKHRQVRYVHVERGSDSLVVRNRAPA